MIDAHQLSDAIPAALFGMFAIWAFASKRHWFLRTAVVGGALLTTLLIPAYEVLAVFGTEALLVVAGLTLWRRRHASRAKLLAASDGATGVFRPQVSLQTLMLITVVVAVLTAVFANAPDLGWHLWISQIGSGVVAASIMLACVWLVVGRWHWTIRLLLALTFCVALAATLPLLEVGRNLFNYYWIAYPTWSLAQFWEGQTLDYLWMRFSYWLPTTVVGVAIICGWLHLMVAADWFIPFSVAAPSPLVPRPNKHRVTWARREVTIYSILLLSFPSYLLYRLMTPTPVPQIVLPNPNGYEDMVAAGREIRAAGIPGWQQWSQITEAQLRQEIAKHEEAASRVHEALQENCRFPFHSYSELAEDDWSPLFALSRLLLLRALHAHAGEVTSLEARQIACLDLLRLAHFESRTCDIDFPLFLDAETAALREIWNFRSELSAQQCVVLANELWELESHREPWDELATRQRILDENAGWESHLQVILSDWSDEQRYENQRYEYWMRQVAMRLLITELAIGAYRSNADRLPTALAELTPDYLPIVLHDPYGDGPLLYRPLGDTYQLYSVGYDQDDDGGITSSQLSPTEWNGDLTPVDLFSSQEDSQSTADVSEPKGLDENAEPSPDAANEHE